MRAFAFFCLVALSPSLFALGRLVQPDGSVAAVVDEATPDGVTYSLSPLSVPTRSWITLPAGTTVISATAVGAGTREVFEFPVVGMPGTRFSVEVPAHVLTLTVHGHPGTSKTLVRTLERPGRPGQAWVSRSSHDLRVDLPRWRIASGYRGVLTLSRPAEGAWSVTLTGDQSERSFAFAPTVLQWNFAPDAWGFVPTQVVIEGDPRLSEVRVRALGPQTDLPADPETLLAWPTSKWRQASHEWFSWTGTSVLVLVTADYRVQDAYLRRLAFFVEKEGYRGRLVTDEELGGQHGWNAHDYAAPDLARFFTKAAQEGFALNQAEEQLRDRLTAAGVLVAHADHTWTAGTGALVGISAASPPALRAALFTHEAFHGLYFTSPSFRSGVAAAWSTLSEPARAAFRSFLAVSHYDPADEGLMVNEFQAYVLQRSARDWTAFFRDRVLERQPTTLLSEFLSAARTLQALVQNLYGLPSGSVSTVAVR